MRRLAVAICFFLITLSAASADQIDYLIACPTETACRNDPALSVYGSVDPSTGTWNWDQSTALPNVQVLVIATGLPLNGNWFIIISTVGRKPSLDADANVVLIADRDKASNGAPPSSFILGSSVDAAQWPLLSVSPTFAGSSYPFGQSQ